MRRKSPHCSSIPNVAALVARPGRAIMTLRHGPVPPGRRMFEVTPDETIALAEQAGLQVTLNVERPSAQAQNLAAGVGWTVLVLEKR
jgi:hypothetical protein